MDLNYSNEELAFRDEVRGWLAKNLPADLSDKVAGHEHLSRDDLVRWHKILAKQGWIAPSWPRSHTGMGMASSSVRPALSSSASAPCWSIMRTSSLV